MKKYYTLLVLLFITMITSCTPGRYIKPIPIKSFVQIVSMSEVEICQDNEPCKILKNTSVGSGVVVFSSQKQNVTFILTASHVCYEPIHRRILNKSRSRAIRLYIRNHKGIMKESEIVAINVNIPKEADLCILKVEDMFLPRVSFSKKQPKIGDIVYNIAAPGGVYHPPAVPIFKGIFSGQVKEGNKMFPKCAMATVASSGGSSGSPLLNKDMKIVGIVFASVLALNQISLITDYLETKEFLINFENNLRAEDPFF